MLKNFDIEMIYSYKLIEERVNLATYFAKKSITDNELKDIYSRLMDKFQENHSNLFTKKLLPALKEMIWINEKIKIKETIFKSYVCKSLPMFIRAAMALHEKVILLYQKNSMVFNLVDFKIKKYVSKNKKNLIEIEEKITSDSEIAEMIFTIFNPKKQIIERKLKKHLFVVGKELFKQTEQL